MWTSVHWHRGELAQAEECYHRSLELQEENQNPQLIASAMNNFGIICGRRGKLKQAEKFLLQSLGLKEEIGNPQDIAESCYQLVQVMTRLHSVIKHSKKLQNQLSHSLNAL
ncbi:MAG: tetratricopeptide repeat protein [Candidatus Heimdallarchaeota archaeon]